MSSLFKIVLVAPDIPGNTGTIGRTCVALNLELILIHPLGFDISEKAVRRAGLDYWKHVKASEFKNFNDFLLAHKPDPDKLFFFSKKATQNYFSGKYQKDCYLIFGSETKGLPEELFEKYPDRFFSMPMYSEHVRSLNLANATTAVAYEALRQINF